MDTATASKAKIDTNAASLNVRVRWPIPDAGRAGASSMPRYPQDDGRPGQANAGTNQIPSVWTGLFDAPQK